MIQPMVPGIAWDHGRCSFGLVGLTAQEGRDFQLIIVHRLMHRQRWAAVHIEPLRSLSGLPPGIVRHGLRHPDRLALWQRGQL